MLKEAPLTLLIRLLDLINMCWRTGHAPEEWNVAVVTPVHKKLSRNDCNNYRGISLLNSCYKIYSKILNNRTSKIAENIVLNNQHGFRKGRSCTNYIFTLNQLIEKEKNIISQSSLGLLSMKRPSIE
jgi:sorting nexin-29